MQDPGYKRSYEDPTVPVATQTMIERSSNLTHCCPTNPISTLNMHASMRIEIFPSSMKRFFDFYVGILQFSVRKHEGTYAFISRDNICVGAIEIANTDSLAEKEGYRRPTKGIEIVFEVDDLVAERDRIIAHGWKLEEDIKTQDWGLQDFRLLDPDSYYVRITTHGPARDSKGEPQ